MALEEKIISILSEDLGPSAHSFLEKQCKALNKNPAGITSDDIGELANSIYAGVKPILGEDIAEKLKQKVLKIS